MGFPRPDDHPLVVSARNEFESCIESFFETFPCGGSARVRNDHVKTYEVILDHAAQVYAVMKHGEPRTRLQVQEELGWLEPDA